MKIEEYGVAIKGAFLRKVLKSSSFIELASKPSMLKEDPNKYSYMVYSIMLNGEPVVEMVFDWLGGRPHEENEYEWVIREPVFHEGRSKYSDYLVLADGLYGLCDGSEILKKVESMFKRVKNEVGGRKHDEKVFL